MSKIAIIGSGFSGLSAAAFISRAGHEVTVFEKNPGAGGRARQLKTGPGYIFDMGPSWYWMPEVFENFFNELGHPVSSLYDLKLLDPSFDIVFPDKNVSIPADYTALRDLFETTEKGSAARLDQFMKEARYKYETAVKSLPRMPGNSIFEFADLHLIKGALRLQLFSSLSRHIRKYFSHPRLIALMEFPALFLGATARDTPALYSLMNYAGLKLGTWYPMGGFGKVVESIQQIGERQGAAFRFSTPVEKIVVERDMAVGILVNKEFLPFDAVIASADYHHVEKDLLPPGYRNYSETYWDHRDMAPSCLVYYTGISKRIRNLRHHTLFFEEDLAAHSKEIYHTPQWPSRPLFYACCPSVTDPGVAPAGHENLFLLMPIAPGLKDNEEIREKYFRIMMDRLEKYTGEKIGAFIDYKKSYCVADFITDYNSYKGNAYGLANTLRQTAFLKPRIRNRKVRNLFYAGQLTVPGPGVPPALISGRLAAVQLMKYLKKQKS